MYFIKRHENKATVMHLVAKCMVNYCQYQLHLKLNKFKV